MFINISLQEEQVRRVPPGERAAAEGVQVEADPLPHPLQEADEGRLHRRGVQEGHSARGPHHATQEGDEEAARDGNHGRHEEDAAPEECDFSFEFFIEQDLSAVQEVLVDPIAENSEKFHGWIQILDSLTLILLSSKLDIMMMTLPQGKMLVSL